MTDTGCFKKSSVVIGVLFAIQMLTEESDIVGEAARQAAAYL